MSLVFLAVNGQTNAVTYAGTNQPMWMTDHGLFFTTADDATPAVADLLSNVNAHNFDVVMGSAPYLTAYYDGSNVNVTLHNAPATPPTSATFSVLGKTYTETITNGVAKFPISVHASLADWRVTVSVNVQGFPYIYVETAGVNVNTSPQLYTDSFSVVHAVPLYNVDLANYWQSQVSANAIWQPADIATVVGLLLELTTKLASAVNLSLDANQQNALNDLVNNIVTKVPVNLETAAPVPASGQPQTYQSHYSSYRSHFLSASQAMQNYESDAATITHYVPLK